jgi:DNA-binding beta-propeller fold protein YncE
MPSPFLKEYIFALKKELNRIHAWDKVQKKKIDNVYWIGTKALKVGSDPICFDNSYVVLKIVLEFLETTIEQDVVYVARHFHSNISIIATHTCKKIATINIQEPSSKIVISRDSTRLYVILQSQISVIATDIGIPKVIDTISVSRGIAGIAISPDGTRLCMSERNRNIVTVIDTHNHTIIGTVDVEKSLTLMVFSPDGKKVYGAKQRDGLELESAESATIISVIATDIFKVIATIDIREFIQDIEDIGSIVISPDGATLYVRYSDIIAVISTENLETNITTIDVRKFMCSIAISLDGTMLYAAHWSNISVIATEKKCIVATIDVKKRIHNVKISPDGTKIYVVHDHTFGSSTTISIIDTRNFKCIRTIHVESANIAIGTLLL